MVTVVWTTQFFYARYIDDIFVQVNNHQQLIDLQNSVLKFTHELNIDNKLPFLDLLIDNNNENFNTKVYHKPTNSGQCLNGNSQCPEKYMNSYIVTYTEPIKLHQLGKTSIAK